MPGLSAVLRILSIFASIGAVLSSCNSFATKCSIAVGSLWTETNGQPIKLNTWQGYYLSFMPPDQGNYVDIDLSVFYGSLQIFVARGRQPKLEDFDQSTIASSERSLRVVRPALPF
eukprot:scaffold437_cov168-Ochromonas_danica.AAC.73